MRYIARLGGTPISASSEANVVRKVCGVRRTGDAVASFRDGRHLMKIR